MKELKIERNYPMLIEINESGYTSDGKLRLIPVNADMNMYYAGASMKVERLEKLNCIDSNLTPSEAFNVWKLMVQGYITDSKDYEEYIVNQ